MIWFRRLELGLLCFSWFGCPVSVHPATAWRHPRLTGESLAGAAFGNGTYLLVGPGGAILKSPDGVQWHARIPAGHYFRDVTFWNNQFVAVGGKIRAGGAPESSYVLTSPDGENWTSHDSKILFPPASVTADGNTLYIISRNGGVSSSTNAATWTLLGNTAGEEIVVFQGTLLAAGFDALLRSANGASFSNVLTVAGLHGLGGDQSTVIAVGDGGLIYHSTNGANWQKSASVTTAKLNSVAAGGTNGFAAVGDSGTILHSPDGVTWSRCDSGMAYNLARVRYLKDRFIATGTNGVFLASTDGLDWLPLNLPLTTQNLTRATWQEGLYVVVGQQGTILTSPDAETWSLRPSGSTRDLAGLAASGTLVVAVGASGEILTSPDAVTWTRQISHTTSSFTSVAHGKNTFVAVAPNLAVTSPDGTNWTTHSVAAFTPTAITFGNGFFAVSASRAGTFARSPDGVTWTAGNTVQPPSITDIAAGAGEYVVVGDSSFGNPSYVMLKSTDALNYSFFSAQTGDGQPELWGIGYGQGIFVAAGTQGGTAFSADGQNWKEGDAGTSLTLNTVTIGGGKIVLAGEGGAILVFPQRPDLSIKMNGGKAAVEVVGAFGKTYRIQSVDSLADTNWVTRATISFTTPTSYNDNGSTQAPARFYRAISP